MILTLNALWLLTALCAATFASAAVTSTFAGARVWPFVAMAIGFAGAGFAARSSIDAGWVGGLAAAVAALELVRPGHYLVTGGAAGACAALWAALMQVQGLPVVIAYPFAASVAVLSGSLSHHTPGFAPALVREEALLGLGTLALGVAMTPAISQGWQSALALNLTDKGASTPAVPLWMFSFIGASMALGGIWSWWRRG